MFGSMYMFRECRHTISVGTIIDPNKKKYM